MSAYRNFTVNSHYQVTVLSVLSPTSQAYAETVPLIFNLNGEIKNAHYYLYKGHESVSEKSVGGNTTLGNLSNGSYDMYLFVTTEYGQASEAVHFSVLDYSHSENLPIIIGAFVLLVFSFAVGLLFYFKRHRHSDGLVKNPRLRVSQERLTRTLLIRKNLWDRRG
jgi:hypothetical protein